MCVFDPDDLLVIISSNFILQSSVTRHDPTLTQTLLSRVTAVATPRVAILSDRTGTVRRSTSTLQSSSDHSVLTPIARR